jgi:hypothetical protein
MKYLKTYEDSRSKWQFDNSKYKQYIITKVVSDRSEDIYINLYENLYHTMNKNSFRALYYYDELDEKIEEYTNRQEIDYIPINKIIYESDDIEDALNTLNTIINSKKYNL